MDKARGGALHGVKVLDLTWSAAGPIAMKWLGEHGATVIKVESRTRIDIARRSGIQKGPPDPDRSGVFAGQNSSKLGITVNLANPRGRDLVLQLAAWADVFAETFSPGVIGRLGLDYHRVLKANPSIVYISSSALGQTGPVARNRFFGTQLSSLAGFTGLTGWPDRPPVLLSGAYTDPVAARFTAMLIVAALDYRRRTGKGCYVDLSQVEAGLQLLTPLFLANQANGTVFGRAGNRSPYAAPHGVYPCLGDDRWIAIAVSSQAEWEALCRVMGRPALASDPRFITVLSRKWCEDELDHVIEQWTRERRAEELAEGLQAAGVPAGVAESHGDLFDDPQLQHRGAFVYLDHKALGRHAYDGTPVHLLASPAEPFAAPCLGQHTEHVLKEILHLDDGTIGDLAAAGALE